MYENRRFCEAKHPFRRDLKLLSFMFVKVKTFVAPFGWGMSALGPPALVILANSSCLGTSFLASVLCNDLQASSCS